MFNRKPTEKEILGQEIPINTPLEYLAFKIPRKALAFLILGLGGAIGAIGLAGINLFILNRMDLITILMQTIQVIISLIFLLQAVLIYQNVIKRGEKIIIREHRGGIITFDKQGLNKKIRFNKKDPTTEPTILWNGTGIEKQSGAQVILLKEGSKSNENINLCVAETDWTKNLAAMVRAKTFADIAESELLNTKTLLGLKWQDVLLIITGLLVLIVIVVQVGITPGAVTDEVMKQIPGALTNAVKSIVLPAGGA